MVTPTISERTWVRVDYWVEILAVADTSQSATDFSFETKLKMLMELKPMENMEDMDTDQFNYSHPDYPDGLEQEYWIPPGTENRVHRPHVSDDFADRLEDWVDENILGPVSSYNFEQRVESFLSALEEYEEALGVYLVETDAPEKYKET